MPTQKSFYDDVYQQNITATVLDCHPLKGGTAFVPDRTVLFPEGGGQPADHGEVLLPDGTVYSITDVHEDADGNIVHLIPLADTVLAPGMSVTLRLDWERRFDNMQRHSGEHVLSGAFYQVTGGANKGFHMGENFITIDISMDGAMLTEEQLDQAESLANRAIWENLPIVTSWFPDAASASVMKTRKPVDLPGKISIVTIGDPEEPFDCVACCGTHVASAGEVGLIKVYKVEPNRGMNRVYFDCGNRAFLRSRADSKLLRTVCERYSAGPDELLHKLDIKEEKESQLRAEHASLLSYVRSEKAGQIASGIPAQGGSLHIHHESVLGPDDLVKLGFAILEKVSDPALLLVLVHDESRTALLFSHGTPACGKLVKEIAHPLGGKGGGRPDNARALFSDSETLQDFLSRLAEVN